MINNSVKKNYIIGVTLHRVQHEEKYFHRFIRIDYVLPFIQKTMEDIQLFDVADTECDRSINQTELPDRIRKRRKLQSSYLQNKI